MRVARAIVPAFVVALLLISAAGDHYFRDEFYYLACTRRLAWGYVDHPPLSVAMLWAVRQVAGESLLVLRLVAALALAATVWLTGRIARRLGAGGFGEALAMVAIAVAPAFLATGTFYSMNVFDVLLWTAALRLLIDLVDGAPLGRWAVFGALLGLGLLNKISVLWLGAGIGVALLTTARPVLRTPGPYLAAAIAGVLFLPHLLWQVANAWPTLEFIEGASRQKMLGKTPWAFMGEQVMNMHPMALAVWGVGLVGLLSAPRLRRYRALAVVYLTAAVILMANSTSRSGYLLPAYPPLIAAGAVMWESWLRQPAWRTAALVVLVLAGAATAPLAVPILPVDRYVRYSASLGIQPSTEEKKDVGRLPQFFADRQGWERFVGQVAAAWDRLTPEERRSAAVLTGNYGEAGAIETLGASRGITAISGHNSYWLWGPAGRTGDVLIVLSTRQERLERLFASVELAGRTECGDCMPYENGLGVYVCRGPRRPLSDVWPDLKHYD
ncbi:MAG: glycosyltransferase family 39 protein [Vicinamibacterales bacterium]